MMTRFFKMIIVIDELVAECNLFINFKYSVMMSLFFMMIIVIEKLVTEHSWLTIN